VVNADWPLPLLASRPNTNRKRGGSTSANLMSIDSALQECRLRIGGAVKDGEKVKDIETANGSNVPACRLPSITGKPPVLMAGKPVDFDV
jgi:hypothetical protein